ncbi:12368_t:CDS:10 [Acaulospora morrowiae]|uniref:12368_t:CDS:1 n=1 Tax=Acaulospora morrowiae TaxID=94023 RepID=A0A9N9DSR6_9GLOM|nr:12368_t:CDS:10 [Acaulospora morrowiae]
MTTHSVSPETSSHTKRMSVTHRREPSVPHEVKETLDATVTETQDGERCLNNYILKEEIGHGAYGTVIMAVDKAIKEFSKSRLRKRDKANYLRRPPRGRGGRGWNARGRAASVPNDVPTDPLYLIRSEVAVLKKLNHKNVVALYEVLDDPDNDSLYMVFEICENGVLMDVSINKKTTPFPNDRCRRYFREMILGFEYLHENEIVHRDIKPDNLLLSKDDVLKIVDFGVSEIFKGEDKIKKSAGSPAFMAPELCIAHHGEISGKAADIWSMGVTLYCLVFGCLPFEEDNIIDLYESIKNDDIKILKETDPDLVDLLHAILEKDPLKRATMPVLREHPWVTERGNNPLISTEENCTELITEITEDDLSAAIKPISIRGVFTVIGAVNKLKRLSRSHHHSMSDIPKLEITKDSDEKNETELKKVSIASEQTAAVAAE